VSNYNKALATDPQLNLDMLFGTPFATVLITSVRHLIEWGYGGLKPRALLVLRCVKPIVPTLLIYYTFTAFFILSIVGMWIIIIIYSSLLPSCSRLGYERPTPHLFLTDISIHSDTQAEPRKLSSLTLYIGLVARGKPAPGQNAHVISPPVVTFRIGVNPEPCAIQHKTSQNGTTKPSPPTFFFVTLRQ
jgi:hypothetical protein